MSKWTLCDLERKVECKRCGVVLEWIASRLGEGLASE